MDYVVGLEVEWYLLRVAEGTLTDDHVGAPGVRGRPIATAPVEPGYSYHSESNMDLMQPVLTALAQAFEKTDLPLRSVENEWGPRAGRMHVRALRGAARRRQSGVLSHRDEANLPAARRVATFMCRPALKGYYSSGWHLHQSLIDVAGANLFVPETAAECLSPLGRNFLGGILRYAALRPHSQRRP